MGMSLEFGIKKKRATQAALSEEILLHKDHGAVRALSLEVVTLLNDQKETKLRSQILNNGESALLSMADLKVLSKGENRALKGKTGIEASLALKQHLEIQAQWLEFSDLALLQPFKVDDSDEEFIKVGNTSAIRTPLVRGMSLFVRVDDVHAEPATKHRFSKSQRVVLITL
jgi:hypothetical protein